MKILLTGFEPFGSVKVNPSEQIVRIISARPQSRGNHEIIAEILPTEFLAAGKKIRRLIRAFRPAIVVCLGVAAARANISLERIAVNVDDESSPDNAGLVRSGKLIAREGPVAYWSTLPLESMRRALNRRGFGATISNHAGTYVCNHVFYVARHEIERMRSHARCGLIHVPAIQARRKDSKAAGMTLSRMVAAVDCCIELLQKRPKRKSR